MVMVRDITALRRAVRRAEEGVLQALVFELRTEARRWACAS
jgi:hypothetical protein